MIVNSRSARYNTQSLHDFMLRAIAPIYDNFNVENFADALDVPEGFSCPVKIVYDAFGKSASISEVSKIGNFPLADNGTVLLAFSAGLDSCYQAFKLRDDGYDVVLFHVRGMNYYTNGQEYKAALAFAEKFGFRMIVAEMHPEVKDKERKKFWKENPVKNEIFFAMMIDYLIENGGNKISSGDDLRLSISKAVPDTNLSDARELTESFMNAFSKVADGLEFMPVGSVNKSERLKYLDEKGAADYYYSCVTAGRLVNYLNKKLIEKYGLVFDRNDCGACRKCAMHDLIRHYWQGKYYPEEYIDKCWNTVAVGADNIFFDKGLPLDVRVKNLIEY